MTQTNTPASALADALAAAPFISFYSFKSGIGRSTALINTAALLAARGFRVLVIDFEFEAPGLSYLVHPPGSAASPGFIDLLTDAKQRGLAADLFTRPVAELATIYTRPYPLEDSGAGGTLHIMPARKWDQGHIMPASALPLRQLSVEGVDQPLIRIFKEKFAGSDVFDYILIDSCRGFSDEAQCCTHDLADYLMILSGLNRQNIEGTSQFLQTLRQTSEGRANAGRANAGRARFQIMLSPVPNWQEELLAAREKVAQHNFDQAWGSALDLSLHIPYHPRLALTEEPGVFCGKGGALLEAYRAIEKRMLTGLGHDARSLGHEFFTEFEDKNYRAALLTLHRLTRFDQEKRVLERIVMQLVTTKLVPTIGTSTRQKEDRPTLTEMLASTSGREMLRFFVDQIPCDNDAHEAQVLATILVRGDKELAGILFRRLADANPDSAISLGNYGHFLRRQRGDKQGAQEYYQRALALDPNHAHNLGNYALFLEQELDDADGALDYYQRAMAADPKNTVILANYVGFMQNRRSNNAPENRNPQDDATASNQPQLRRASDPKPANGLGNYALYLEQDRGDMDRAQEYYLLALAANPKSVNTLFNYANFLTNRREEHDGAQQHYQQALALDPKHADLHFAYAFLLENRLADFDGAQEHYLRSLELSPNNPDFLENYANFLKSRGDLAGARDYYQRALEAGPTDANRLANYGQVLLGLGQFAQGEQALLAAIEHNAPSNSGALAESCFSLWLALRMQGKEARRPLQGYKTYLQQNFERTPWNFDAMLTQSKKILEAEEQMLAQALAAAFLDEGSVAQLDEFGQWREVVAQAVK